MSREVHVQFCEQRRGKFLALTLLIVTAHSKELLETTVKPAIQAFLCEHGLQLSAEKTHLTHIKEGFDFLGFNIRKYNGKLLIKPSKRGVKKLLNTLRKTLKSYRSAKVSELLININPKILGWCLYYRQNGLGDWG